VAAASADSSAQAQAQPAAAPAPSALTPPPVAAQRRTFIFAGELTQGGWIRGQAPSGAINAKLGETTLDLDAEGHFFAAFDLDAAGQVELVADLADGSHVVTPLQISPRAWNIEHINAARSPGGASAEFMERRRPELARINAAREVNAPAIGWSQAFIWPLTGRISGRFGSQRVYRGEPGSYHSGIDIATGGTGNPYVSPAAGVVTLAAQSPFSLEGNLLIVDHGHGLNSAFLHSSRLAVVEGQVVEQGQLLGYIGATGRATGPHLHWSLMWRGARLDPLLFTGPMS
jgi:murein DD-endopeptidase MepM/ murein hydrolase activator NlpD